MLDSLVVNQQYEKQKVSRWSYDTIYAKEYGDLVGDLLEFTLQKRSNRAGGSKHWLYALTIQDIRSRKVWVRRLAKKDGSEALPALKQIMAEIANDVQIRSLTFDGEGFVASRASLNYLASLNNSNGIEVWLVPKTERGPGQLRTLDAWHKDFRNRLTRYWRNTNTRNWPKPDPPNTAPNQSPLMAITEAKNNTKVITIGQNPNHVWSLQINASPQTAANPNGFSTDRKSTHFYKPDSYAEQYGICRVGKACDSKQRQELHTSARYIPNIPKSGI